jgi:hypothetical protein
MTRPLWPSAPAPQRYQVPTDNAFGLTVHQWRNAAVLGVLMGILFLALTFGADVWAIVGKG